jgi:hypothetical protein
MGKRPHRDILVRCPTTGTVVRTGLNTGIVHFGSLAGLPFSVVCSACGKNHSWKQRHAWIDGETVPAGKDAAEENNRHAVDMAQKLSHQLRAAEGRDADLEAEVALCQDKAEDRVAELEAQVALYRDKADRAEQLLNKVYREIEERLKRPQEKRNPAPSSPLPGTGRRASAKDHFLKAPSRLSHEVRQPKSPMHDRNISK